jgi:hypothetical protein
MRAIVTIAPLLIMAGMIFASLTADAPAAGLLNLISGESSRSEFLDDKPGQRSGNLLFHLKSMLQDF